VRVLFAIAWRNLWRNYRRTLFTSVAIGFAVLLMMVSLAMQSGNYEVMLKNATGLMSGQIQIQQEDYREDRDFRAVIPHSSELLARLKTIPGVLNASPRASAFALVSAGDRSFGAEVMGIDAEGERAVSTLGDFLVAGKVPSNAQPDGAFLGEKLARNLGVGVNAEIVVLGTTTEGGVAAMVLRVRGLFDSGQSNLDRALLQVPLQTFQKTFELTDATHVLIVTTADVLGSEGVAANIQQILPHHILALPWQQLVPELDQTFALKRAGTKVFFALLALMVTLSIVNTFIMTIFERKPEFGMLLALGMRPWSIILMLMLESLWLCLLGVLLGVLVGSALILLFSQIGVPLPDVGEAVLRRYHLPDRLYPAFDLESMVMGPLVMLAATQIAAFLATIRVRKFVTVEALRAVE